ncbi:hypothetical protein STCU_06073 [Strigomonas culicis]|nr:hypothetical protein STCU_06073 [Strigomonas culicis]|eukprot:EPY26799.1 hypothetical protein STCU_06073 [Strigomonas culicis]
MHSTWTCVLLLVLCNWILLDRSPDLYELPRLVASLPPSALPIFAGGNAALFCVLYYTFVGRGGPRGDGQGSGLLPSAGVDEGKKERQCLEEFALKREREKRLDLVVSFITLVNVAVLLYAGVIPVGNLKMGMLVLTRLFSG